MSDFNYRGKLPFRIISSSVNTGYNAELTAAVGYNIEIVDQHRDEYAGLQDSPLQGPFTEEWVGGNQHRHVDLNTGNDDPNKRPEAFLVSGSSGKVRIYGPTHFDINAPKALLTRDNVAKSPVNIKNIRNENRRLGNFSKNYQVVQTSGRDINQSLIENNLTASGVLTTKFINGVQDYTLPEEPNNKTVFVERFNAPGGVNESSRAALDRASEQYSPNNSLVTRNIKVRQPFYSQLTKTSPKSFLSKLNFLDTSTIYGSSVTSFTFSADGLKIYVAIGNYVFQYNLTKPYELSTAAYYGNLIPAVVGGVGITFNNDGTKLYIANTTGGLQYYTVSEPWDITTANYSSLLTGFSLNISGILFTDNGNKFYTITSTKIITCYTASTPWTPNSADSNTTFTLTSDIQISTGVAVRKDGTQVYITDRFGGEIYEYILSSPHDVSTATFSKKYFLGNNDSENWDLFLQPETNERLFILDRTKNRVDCYVNFMGDYATEHKVNKNSINTVKEIGGFVGNYGTSSKNDNFWVQHAIPSTDLRYKWIADSVVSSQQLIQYQKLYDSTELIFNSASLVTSGSNSQFQIDNIGINSIVKNNKSINTSTNTFAITNSSVSASYTEIANTPYGFSSWKEIRGGEHPVARALRNNNIISVQTPERPIVNGRLTTRKRSNNVSNFTEPPVTNKHKPLTQALKLKGGDKTYYFISTYNNNLSTVVDTQLKDILGLNENSTQIGDMLGTYYRAINRSSDVNNPVEKLENLIYSETLYPREVNAYLAQTRGRTQYILNQAGTGSRDGYDIQLGTQRAFWRDQLEDRKRSNNGFYNSMNYLNKQLREISTEGSGSMYNVPGLANYAVRYYYNQLKQNVDSFDNSIKPIDNNNKNVYKEYINAVSYIDYVGGDNFWIGTKQIDNGCSGELNSELFCDYYTYNDDPGADDETQLTRVTAHSVLTQYESRLNTTQSFASFSTYLLSGTNKSNIANIPIPKPNYLAFLGGFESGSREYNSPTTRPDVLDLSQHRFYNRKPVGDILSTLDSGLRYASESFGDKKPWFDSYEDYSDDIRSYAKDHSILPEFRVSSHIPYYVTEEGGNFRAKNKSFLELDGVGENYRSSDDEVRNLYNSDFINSFVTTDTSDGAEIQKDNANLKLQNINFTVSGIKKLLPYNGFYPQERTIQLANLFSDFLDENVDGGYFKFMTSSLNYGELIINLGLQDITKEYFFKNTVLPYFFAPGILYNTIKSGISVGFPAILIDNFETITSEVGGAAQDVLVAKTTVDIGIKDLGVTGSYLRNNLISSGSRITFDKLIFPQNIIPSNAIFDLEVPNGTLEAYATTSGGCDLLLQKAKRIFKNTLINIKMDCYANPEIFPFKDTNAGFGWKEAIPFAYFKNNTLLNPSYSMAMSNFLAEIPTFFLKNGTMNVFRSAETKDWKTFEIGKKYYFDLKMKKSSDLVMIEAYSSSYHVTGETDLEKSFNGRYFGWPVNKISGSRANKDNTLVHNDPAYAPFTPPYFEGDATLRFELSASKTTYNSVNDLITDIKIINIFDILGQTINSGSEAYINKMSIQDCMEIFGIGQNPITSFNNTNNPDNFEQAPNTSKQYWAISPKLETPVLDFSDQTFVSNTGSYWVSSGYGRGMWSGYGKIPTGSKGITIEIAESFPLQTGFRTNLVIDNPKTGSLLQQVGFQAESAKIGQLAESKTISEAIIMIPYVDTGIPGVTTFIDNHHFFALNKDIFNTLNSDVERGVPSVIPGGQIGYESSITKMIKGMKNYVIPPRFNFLKYNNIDPFVMYLFEFKHDLDQQDLADIWQGVMPKIGTTAEHDTLQFGHKTGEFELFGKDFTPPSNMRWMVFKVKKKAEWNYFAITENIGDDQNFKFKFANSQEAKTPDYSYNWPYDYFSLVELAKVDVTYDYQEVSGSSQFQQSVIINTGG